MIKSLLLAAGITLAASSVSFAQQATQIPCTHTLTANGENCLAIGWGIIGKTTVPNNFLAGPSTGNAGPSLWRPITPSDLPIGTVAQPQPLIVGSNITNVTVTNANNGQLIVIKSGAASAVNYTCPVANTAELSFKIVDGLGVDNQFPITITPTSGSIDGATSYTMNHSVANTLPYESAIITCDASGNSWLN